MEENLFEQRKLEEFKDEVCRASTYLRDTWKPLGQIEYG
jgi:hypothetical protein